MIDFHQHLNDPQNPGKEITCCGPRGFLSGLLFEQEKRLKDWGCERANIIFNQPHFLREETVEAEIDKYLQEGEGTIFFTLMIDPHDPSAGKRLEQLRRKFHCVLGVKFHPILQKIGQDQFNDVLEIVRFASANGMFVMVDGSYGAPSIYQFDHLALVDFLCRNIKTPLVFAHSGALKVKEAFLVAMETPNQNLYFDTSFILSFWKGSSVEQDLGFVIKKLGVKRFFFGSDYPYLDFKEEYELQRRFLEALGLSFLEQQYFFNASAQEFLTKLM